MSATSSAEVVALCRVSGGDAAALLRREFGAIRKMGDVMMRARLEEAAAGVSVCSAFFEEVEGLLQEASFALARELGRLGKVAA